MKKTFLLFVLLSSGIFATSCGNRSQTASDDIQAMADTSRNALDWEGTYYGVLPCADCEGIETVISIFYDNTFVKKTRYLGKNDQVFEIAGTFTWNELGNIITFDGAHSQHAPGGLLVGEMQLFHLDQDGQRITGELAEYYRLPKVDGSLFGKTWKLIELNGAKVEVDESRAKTPQLMFDAGESRFAGNAGCNQIMGQFKLDEDPYSIEFSQVGSTLMLCPDMELETEFIRMIETVDNYNLVGDTLVLNKAKMAPLARFVADYFAKQ